MEKRDLSGLEVSLLGFGCMRFPTLKNGQIDEDLSAKMLDFAYENGVNYFDTAVPYHDGKSEEFIGRYLNKYPRDSYFLATKFPVWSCNSLDDAKAIFQRQLQTVGKDYIDFYMLHALHSSVYQKMKKLGIPEYFDEMKKAGKIKRFGFSFHDSYSVFEEIINDRDWDFCQIQFNYMDTENQAGIKGYELAKERGVPVIVMEPLRGGAISSFSEDIEELFYAHGKEKSISSYALRYVAGFDNVKLILSGMSNMEQVIDNVRTLGEFAPLSSSEEITVQKVVDRLQGRIKSRCGDCRYCMPCPCGVNISEHFKIWNDYHKYQKFDVVSYAWGVLQEENKSCIGCGACLEKCPQKIDIPSDLEKVIAELSLSKGARMYD